jgi:hypothetical protein
VLPWDVRFRQLEMRSEFGKTRIMPNSQRVAEAGKGVAGVDVKTRSVVMPNWRAKTLISSGREAGRPNGSEPSTALRTGPCDAQGRAKKRRKPHPFWAR